MSLNSKGNAAQACQHSVTWKNCFNVFHEQIPCPAFNIAPMVHMATIQGLHRLKLLGRGEFMLALLSVVLLWS